MLGTLKDIEYLKPYPVGHVTNHIRSRLADFPVGMSVRFAPDDYAGIPIFHFHNTLKSVLTSQYGGSNVQMQLDQQKGIIEARRIR